jgi:glycosyltransferase involved in cell wall biosynthesis
LKILYHHRIASKDGQYVHVEELTNAFIELGHELTFVAPEFSKKAEFGDDGGISAKLKKALPKAAYEILELGYSFVVAFKLISAILKSRPDFIYERYNLHQPAGVMVAKLFKIPLLLEVNAPLVDEREKYSGLALKKLARVIENFTWRNADVVLPVTAVLGQIIENTGVKAKAIQVIHNGINENALDREFALKEAFDSDTITIGFVGFINPWHRLDLAIEAIADHKDKDIQLVCVGDGDIKPELEQQAKILGIADKVTFTGLLTRSEVFKTIQTFDIALQPSVTAYASPLKLFEYMAASCLIIAPRSDNICEIISEQNAVLFKLDDYIDFSDKLTQVIGNFEDCNIKRKLAREAINTQQFTWQANANRVVQLAQDAIDRQ